MANFSTSNLVKAQALLNERFQAPELREQQIPVLNLGRQNSEIIIPSHQTLRTREDRAIEAYIISRNKRTTTGSSRTYNHTGTIGDSISVNLVWTSFVDKFKMSLKLLDNNMLEANQVLANQFEQCFQNIRNDVEQFLITYLLSEKTQVNIATKNGEWNDTDFVFEIESTTEKGLFFEDAKSMMRQNYYNGLYDVIADSTLYRNARFYAAQGSSNAVNTAFQFSGMNIRESIGLTDSDYTAGVGLFLPVNTFAVLDWIPRQNRQGLGNYNTYLGGYGSIIDPISGMTFAVHGYSQRADTSATNGSRQDDVIEFEVSIDLSPNLAPLSTEDETVVFEVAQV
ncbi:MAG: hypothetical protein LBK94_13425 [Prevotellaceae bacterium]|jgi:hypothetical protein|nr:hypothetical protein [Prevotellaceae bacterium]